MNHYQNPDLPIDVRVDDLLDRMTLAEKAGLMFHTMAAITPDGTPAAGDAMIPATEPLIRDGHLNHFNILTFQPVAPRLIAQWHNQIQEIAASTRLGIPVTVSSDPRHGVVDNPATSAAAGGFSAWPEPIGLGATKSPDLVRQFADTVRQEYLATGIRVALHPMADLATEPRWARTAGTLGSDADMVSALVAAYVTGLQGSAPGPDSVLAMVKHFPGAGPQKDGEDAHFAYGREQVYPGDGWEYHLRPFEAAFAAGAAQVMPYYGMPVGTDYEEVGFSFNQGVIEGLLRQRFGFDGVVCTDWGLVTDGEAMGTKMPARAWGVEHLDRLSRAEKLLRAGVDQLGGEQCPELIVELVEQGRISPARIDLSARRILRDKFRLGLFDERRYVDVDRAGQIAGQQSFRERGLRAQQESVVVLTDHATLPLAEGISVYLEGVDPAVAGGYAKVVDDPAEADVAIVRRQAPYDHRPNGFEAYFHAGRLEYTEEEIAGLLELAATVPTIVDVLLDRPAVLTPLTAPAAALVGTFGAGDQALLDVLFGRCRASGTLPFELPSSMAAVEASREDVPNDTADPLFGYGHGLVPEIPQH